MTLNSFFAEFRKCGGVRLPNGYILFRRPVELYNLNTNESLLFRTVQEALDASIGDCTIREHIDQADMSLFKYEYDGRGRSGSGNSQEFQFGNADNGNGEDNTRADFPARVNINSTNSSPERTLDLFRQLHVNDDYESAFTVDEQGFVTQYVHGNPTSVGIWGKAGEMVYHNHPSGGAFSKNDLLNMTTTAAKGIVASGKNGDYIFQKSNNFKANEFAKAVNTVKMRGSSYDDAVDKWLKKNQRKYGYQYVFKKA